MVADSLLQRLSPPPGLSVELAPHPQPRRRLIPATGTVSTSHRPGGLLLRLHIPRHPCSPYAIVRPLPHSAMFSRASGPEGHCTAPADQADQRPIKSRNPRIQAAFLIGRTPITRRMLPITPCRRSVRGRRRVLIGKPPIRKTL
jgi:hypothetical protein